MAINFPNSPNTNDTHTDGGRTWIWDGTTWKIYSSSTSGIGLSDLSVSTTSTGTAALSYNNTTGVFTYTPPDLGANAYSLPTASTTVLGGVKVDGSTITINGSGVISGASTYSLPTASTTVLGGVKVDGTTITINNGVISGASSVPTSITVADESTDTTCYPLFSTDATGNIAPKTVTSFKLNSQTGQVEAGSFKKTGGTSSEFLKADGSIDSTSYLSSYTIPNSGVTAGSYTNSNITVGADGRVTAAASGSAATNIPLGGIIMWYGASNQIPAGWTLCNGATVNGYTTPNLQDKFVIGAGFTYSVNATGGSKDAVVVEHKHTTSIDGGHVIPGNGGNSYSYGGAGTYASTIFSMQNEGVSGNNKNLPPYWALCYIMRTS